MTMTMTDSIRDPSFAQSSDAVRRSMTRNSHYSHTSTQSWVISNQQNPPPPPPEMSESISPSPMRNPRPLPHPQHHRAQSLRPTLEDEEEQMDIDGHIQEMDMQAGSPTEEFGGGPGGRTPGPPGTVPHSLRNTGPREGGKSIVSGFVSGLKKLPKTVLKYGTFGERRRFVRRGTFGSGATITDATGMTTGNTLPLYVSNPPTPVAGPSNTRFIEAMDMPMPFTGQEPSSVLRGPSLSQRHRNPSFRVTPPSEDVGHQETSILPERTFPLDPPQFAEGESSRNANTVTIYHLPGQDEYPTDGPTFPLPTPAPNRRSDSHRQSTLDTSPTPLAATEETQQQQDQQQQSPVLVHPAPASDYRKMTLSSSPLSPLARSALTTSLSSSSSPSFSSELNPLKRFFLGLYHLPWVAHDRVTVDYRPSTAARNRRIEGRSMVKKPMSSWYRGTPGVVLSLKAGGGSGELDLLSSGSPSSRGSSGGTSATPLTPPPIAMRRRHDSADRHQHHHNNNQRHNQRPRHRHRHMLEDNMAVVERRRDHYRDRDRHHHHHHHHHRYRNTFSSSATGETMMQQRPSSASPIIPAVYPYTYPYTYPAYPGFAAPPPAHPPPAGALTVPHRTRSASTPRGPRPHRNGSGSSTQQETYPHGYALHHRHHHHPHPHAPYLPPPPQPPPPVYFIQSNSPAQSGGSNAGDAAAAVGQQQPPQMLSPVYAMQLVSSGTMPYSHEQGGGVQASLPPSVPVGET